MKIVWILIVLAGLAMVAKPYLAEMGGGLTEPLATRAPAGPSPEELIAAERARIRTAPKLEWQPPAVAQPDPRAVLEPGVYVLQAGSFSRYEDADRRRAELALHGIESSIQRITIDDKTYHRVRIGPIDNLDELNVTRSRLRAANIDVLRIKLGE